MPQLAQDVTLYVGSTTALDFTLDGGEDVTGHIVKWALYSAYSTTPIVQKSSANPGEVDRAVGSCTVHIDGGDTGDLIGLGGEPYRHELLDIDGSGKPVHLAFGAVTIRKTAIQS